MTPAALSNCLPMSYAVACSSLTDCALQTSSKVASAASTASAGAVDPTGEVEVFLGGGGQDPNGNDPPGVGRDDPRPRPDRPLLADHHIGTDMEPDPRLY